MQIIMWQKQFYYYNFHAWSFRFLLLKYQQQQNKSN